MHGFYLWHGSMNWNFVKLELKAAFMYTDLAFLFPIGGCDCTSHRAEYLVPQWTHSEPTWFRSWIKVGYIYLIACMLPIYQFDGACKQVAYQDLGGPEIVFAVGPASSPQNYIWWQDKVYGEWGLLILDVQLIFSGA